MSVPVTSTRKESGADRHAARRAWVARAGLLAVLVTTAMLGHDGRRVGQMLALSAPLVMWLAWPVRRRWHRARAIAVWLLAMAFAVDGALRVFLLEAYQAAPNSALVLTAVANTTPREGVEFLLSHQHTALLGISALLGVGALVGWAAFEGARHPRSVGRPVMAALLIVLLVGAVAHAVKPWRRFHPVVFWSQWLDAVQELSAGWADRQHARATVLAQARTLSPTVVRAGPATVVLVLTDSVNRDNLGIYGYGRATTPRLQALDARFGDRLLVLPHAWSVDASTLPALRHLFGFGQVKATTTATTTAPPHLLALARAAGYRVWWLSNHDDVAIEQEHARYAHTVELVNRVPGRSGAMLDEALLDPLARALAAPGERKLIVLHLLGAHPHYARRYPEGANPFLAGTDAEDAAMVRAARSPWVRRLRAEYDAALRYHDSVVAETLRLTHADAPRDAYKAWVYLSDHGQNVGHVGDEAGHSPDTPAGYRIPALVWRSDRRPNQGGAVQPFRSDWAGWTLAGLLHLRWARQGSEAQVRDALHPRYRWDRPVLPIPVESFAG